MTLEHDLAAEPWRFDLFTVLRAAERSRPDKPRIGTSATIVDDIVRLGQDPYLEFPAANITEAGRDGAGRLRLLVRFLGLFGPQGALPINTTEESYGWLLARDDAFPRFADVVQNRFLQLFFRAYAQSRPIVHRDRPQDDRFADWLGSVAGLGTAAYEDADSLARDVKLEHIGLIGPEVASASRLQAFLESVFEVKVEIDEFVGLWLTLDPSECSRLGGAMSRLGVDTVLGASAYSVVDKFRIRVRVETLDDYGRFLPGGRDATRLADAVFLMIGDEVDFDVEIAIPEKAVAPARLGGAGRLGWTGWMLDPKADPGERIRSDARFHLSSRAKRTRSERGT